MAGEVPQYISTQLVVFRPKIWVFSFKINAVLCFNQQRYATAAVMLSILLEVLTVTLTFTRQQFCSRHCNQVSATS